MNPEAVNKRKRKYTGQVLTDFDRNVLPLLDMEDPAVKKVVGKFKSNVRDKFKRMAEDGIDLMNPGVEHNGAAIHLRDRLGERRRPTEHIGAAAA